METNLTWTRLIKRKRVTEGELSLQITSLADILIIVLIFLLKSFSNGMGEAENIQVSSEIRLPMADSQGKAVQGIKVEIAEGRVDVAGRSIASLSDFRFAGEELNRDLADNGTSKALNAEFVRAREEARVNQAPDTVWIVADSRAPYATIQTVIASAAASGFTDFKLAVTQGD